MDLQSITFQPLVGTAREVREVSALWHNVGAAQVVVGAAANGDDLQVRCAEASCPPPRHTWLLPEQCLRASAEWHSRGGRAGQGGDCDGAESLAALGLALAGANRRAQARGRRGRGILTAEEVSMLDLHGVEWAVLSACDTGVGEIKAGEGVFGLRRGFQVAGAGTVIMSRWSVDDQETAPWMRALNESRFERQLSTADAVHQASLTVLPERRPRGLARTRSSGPRSSPRETGRFVETRGFEAPGVRNTNVRTAGRRSRLRREGRVHRTQRGLNVLGPRTRSPARSRAGIPRGDRWGAVPPGLAEGHHLVRRHRRRSGLAAASSP